MAGLTRDGIAMTVRTGDTPLADGGGITDTRNFVFSGRMAFLAGEILATHMNILQGRRMFQGAVQISVLDGIPATATPVARPAIGAGGKPHLLRDCRQVETLLFTSAACGCFSVCACGIMADQAVNARGIRKIKIFVFPSVTRVAAGTPAPVGDGGYSEIVDQFPFAQIRAALLPQHIGAGARVERNPGDFPPDRASRL